MRKYFKITSMLIAFLVMTMTFTVRSYAATAEISADKSSCANGDTVNVDVKLSADGELTSAPEINIVYNPNRLQFDNCSVEYGGGGGGLITISDLEATITFTTLSGGDAKVEVVAALGEEACQSECVISVEGEDTAQGTDDMMESGTGVEATSIAAGNGRLVQSVFSNDYLPKLFEKSTTNFQGQQVECARFSAGDMVLLFTTDESGQDANFMIYNEASGELDNYRMIEGIENQFIILLRECDGDVPNGYVRSELDWNGQLLTAYLNETTNAGTAICFDGIQPTDFFLVYALNSEGAKGWYQYDRKDGTYQRFVQYTNELMSAADPLVDENESSKSDETFLDEYISGEVQMILLFVFAALVLILLIVVIVLGVKVAHYDDYEYMDPEEYMRMQSASAKRNTGVTASSIVKKSMKDEDDEDEDEDEAEKDNRKSSKDYSKKTSAKNTEKSVNKKSKSKDIEELDDVDLEDEELEDDDKTVPANKKAGKKVSVEELDDELEDDDDVSDDEIDDDSDENYSDDADDADDDEAEDDETEEDEDDDVYFTPHMTKKESKAYEKQLRKEEKLAAKEEKWRLKEEKRAAKMRAKGYEEASPMDWTTFGEERDDSDDLRRPKGKSTMPSYMRDNYEEEEEEIVEAPVKRSSEKKTPARKNSVPMSAQREAESAKERKEDELRMKQKRLFEQQQRIEEQRRIEQEQYEEEQRLAQERFVQSQQADEDLDEDFQFEFLDID